MNSNNWPSFPLSDPQFYLGLVNDDEDDINNIAAAVAVTPFENQESSKYKVDEVEAMCNLQQLTLFTGAKKQPDQPPPTSGQRTSIYRGGHGGMRIIYGIIVAEGKASPGKDVKLLKTVWIYVFPIAGQLYSNSGFELSYLGSLTNIHEVSSGAVLGHFRLSSVRLTFLNLIVKSSGLVNIGSLVLTMLPANNTDKMVTTGHIASIGMVALSYV
ncbi:hypothetical protein OROMI_033794 [Orobanche minor]